MFCFGFGFRTQKGRKRRASSPSADWFGVVVGLVSLPIFDFLLAAFTPPEGVRQIVSLAFDDVDVGSLNHIFPGRNISAVTAGKTHLRIHPAPSKNGRHKISLKATQRLRSSFHSTASSEPFLETDSSLFQIRGAFRTGCKTHF
jgi:hypothetical protein